jgi:Cu+-exporting ATPase
MSNQELLELDIEGMTCTACARRIEKNLNKVPGLSAYVDFATEKAHLQLSNEVATEDITKAVESAGYKVGSGKSELKTLKPRLIIGSILSIFAMAFAMIEALHFDGVGYLVFALATPVFFYVAYPFHQAAIKNLRKFDSTMDTLVSLGSSAAYFYSVYLLLAGDMHSYFEVAAVVPTVVLLGRFIEVRARRSATDAVRSMLAAIPQTATIEIDGVRKEIQTSEIKPGAIILVAAGQAVPVDGKLLSANALIDSSTLTGESLPVELLLEDSVAAGVTSLSGEIRLSAISTSANSRLSKIADLVREATSTKTKLGSLADRISSFFVPSVIVISIATFAIWTLIGAETNIAFSAAITVLVIACPCALGIAVPISLVVATSLGAKRSIVIRDPDSLRLMKKITKVVFDKTGTLTDGKLKVVNSIGLGGVSQAQMLGYAAAIEAGSTHPVAKAISQLSQEFTAIEIKETPGRGLSGFVLDKHVFVEKPGSYKNQTELDQALKAAGPNTLVVVSWDGQAHGLIELSDQIRPGAKATIDALHKMNIKTTILSGDNDARVGFIAGELGIDEYLGGVSPEGKLEFLTNQTEIVAMVGDGINDVAALAGADIGIAMGSGSQAAQAASVITILDDDPLQIPYALDLAKKTYRNILQNLGWAFGYNVLLIPVAAIGLLNPMLAGLAMAFSSVSVVLNALRLKWRDKKTQAKANSSAIHS